MEEVRYGRKRGIDWTLSLLGTRSAIIVEVGGIRDARDRAMLGDGWSTVAWAHYVQKYGGRVYTIDQDITCSRAFMEVWEKLGLGYERVVSHYGEDALDYLALWSRSRSIDLLYLDGPDYLGKDKEASEQWHIQLYERMKGCLGSGGMILIDDMYEDGSGKGRLVIERALGEGWERVFDPNTDRGIQQTLLRKP